MRPQNAETLQFSAENCTNRKKLIMNKGLTGRQRRAIEALMLTNTIARAAKKAKVGERSIYVWLKQEHFQTALRTARQEALAHTTSRLQQISARAVDTLEGVMEDENTSSASRISAARLSLDMMYRGAAIDDIVERLKTVEKQALSQQNR